MSSTSNELSDDSSSWDTSEPELLANSDSESDDEPDDDAMSSNASDHDSADESVDGFGSDPPSDDEAEDIDDEEAATTFVHFLSSLPVLSTLPFGTSAQSCGLHGNVGPRLANAMP